MNFLFAIATFLYFLGMIKYLLYLALRNKILFILATVMIFSGFVFETVALAQRSMVTGHGPYTNIFEYCVFSGWIIFGVFLIAEGYFRIKQLGAFMVPIGFALMLFSLPFSHSAGSDLPVTAYWLTLHRTMSFLGFGAFTLIFAAGLMYLIQERQLKSKHIGGWYHRLPSLDILDNVNRTGLIFGFPMLTIGVMAAGVWSSQNYGTIVELKLSNTLLLLGWSVYAVVSVGRFRFGWRGRRAATLGIAGFGIVAAALLVHIS